MKKARKSRAYAALIDTFNGSVTNEGVRTVYYTVIPYDKKGREIPSSVTCCYNADYFEHEDILMITQAL
jgi:hypothetical protein